MPKKRRNQGRNKYNRGHVKPIVCVNCGRLCPKDKAVKRFTIRDIVDASSKKDLEENRAFEQYVVPKLYIKMQYCVGCGIHARIVKVRSVVERRNRAPPQRVQRDAAGKVIQKKDDQKWNHQIYTATYYSIIYLLLKKVLWKWTVINLSIFPLNNKEQIRSWYRRCWSSG